MTLLRFILPSIKSGIPSIRQFTLNQFRNTLIIYKSLGFKLIFVELRYPVLTAQTIGSPTSLSHELLELKKGTNKNLCYMCIYNSETLVYVNVLKYLYCIKTR